MAMTRAPKRPGLPAAPALAAEEQEVLEVIQRGGSVRSDRSTPLVLTDPQKNVQLRVYQSTLDEIDDLRRQTAGGRRPASRHAWMLQAIEEKLEREHQK